MKFVALAAFSVKACVVALCSRTAPLTLSNTGRIASIDCEIRCIDSIEWAASPCSASILRAISSVACWVCTASAFTSDATTAKPRPASPARAASIVELSASNVVCRAIEAIRLTTLPIACDDCRRRSTPSLAAAAAALASSARLAAFITCVPIPAADLAKASDACEKVAAVCPASPERAVSAAVRPRMVDRVSAVEAAPSATDAAARSTCRTMATRSSSSSSSVRCADPCSTASGAGSGAVAGVGSGAPVSIVGADSR